MTFKKGLEIPVQTSINIEGLTLDKGKKKKRGNSWRYKILFKTNSSSKEAILTTLKLPSCTLKIYEERTSVGSNLKSSSEFFNKLSSLNKEALSKAPKPLSFALEVYKEWSSVRSSLNAP